jgi:hypothetical protein
MTLRSLGGLASADSSNQASAANATPVSFALSGQADVFNAIATRLQTMASNSPTTEFLQSILPNAQPTLQANAIPVNRPSNISGANPNISVGVDVGNDGKIADLSYATLDRMVERLNTNPSLMFEIQTSSAFSAVSGQDLETFKLLAVRSYLLDKGVSSDRILLSSNRANQAGNSQVYISLNVDESNINIATTPTTLPTSQASATTVPVPLATADTSTSPLAVLLEADRRLSNWLESAIPDSQLNPQFNPVFNTSIQIPNLEFSPLLTQLPTVDSFLLAIARPVDPALSSDDRNRLWSYAFETSPTQLVSMLLGNDLNNNTANSPANINPTDGATRRLATAFNFLLTSEGDTVTALLRAMGISTTEKSGFVIDPDQLSNLKN